MPDSNPALTGSSGSRLAESATVQGYTIPTRNPAAVIPIQNVCSICDRVPPAGFYRYGSVCPNCGEMLILREKRI